MDVNLFGLFTLILVPVAGIVAAIYLVVVRRRRS